MWVWDGFRIGIANALLVFHAFILWRQDDASSHAHICFIQCELLHMTSVVNNRGLPTSFRFHQKPRGFWPRGNKPKICKNLNIEPQQLEILIMWFELGKRRVVLGFRRAVSWTSCDLVNPWVFNSFFQLMIHHPKTSSSSHSEHFPNVPLIYLLQNGFYS